MRKGVNPTKTDNLLIQKYYHRVIVPVYIPELTGYFTDSLEILQICLESLFITKNKGTAVTIINNACCQKVTDYLILKFKEGQIDMLIHNQENLGKVDPLVGAARSCHEQLITISDADVLFMNGWQEGVEEVFFHFPRAGMVSPVPSAKAYNSFTSYTILYGIIRNNLKFENACDPEALRMFAKSIGREQDFYHDCHLEKQLVMSKKKFKAVIGCGHFIATFRKQIFEFAPKVPSMKKILGNSENDYLDLPNDKAGYLRLATVNNYAFHLGNSKEPWMEKKLQEVKDTQKNIDGISCPNFIIKVKPNPILFNFRSKLITKLLEGRITRAIIFNLWGLPKKYIKIY
jgi:hypothetical protein